MENISDKPVQSNRRIASTNGVHEEQADLFEDLAALRLPQDYTKHTATTERPVSVRKPAAEWWIRTHHDPSFEMKAGILELKEERGESYLVIPELLPALATEPTVSARLLKPTVTRQGTLFIWPLRLPSGGRDEPWITTALGAASAAQQNWVRMSWSNQDRGYVYQFATAAVGDPVWPGLSFSAMLRKAFGDRTIRDMDHPVLRRLRGEV